MRRPAKQNCRSRSRPVARVAFDLGARAMVGCMAPAAAWQGPGRGPGTNAQDPLFPKMLCALARCAAAMAGVVSSVHTIPVLVPLLARTSVRPGLYGALCRSAIAKCRRLLPGTIPHCHHSKSKHGPSLALWAVARTCLLRSSKHNGDIFRDRAWCQPRRRVHSRATTYCLPDRHRGKGKASGSQLESGSGFWCSKQDAIFVLFCSISFHFIFQIPHDLKSRLLYRRRGIPSPRPSPCVRRHHPTYTDCLGA